MKKRILVFLLVVFLIVLLFPIKLRESDGGSVSYVAILYSVSYVNEWHVGPRGGESTLTKGTIIKIVGYTVYDSTETFEA